MAFPVPASAAGGSGAREPRTASTSTARARIPDIARFASRHLRQRRKRREPQLTRTIRDRMAEHIDALLGPDPSQGMQGGDPHLRRPLAVVGRLAECGQRSRAGKRRQHCCADRREQDTGVRSHASKLATRSGSSSPAGFLSRAFSATARSPSSGSRRADRPTSGRAGTARASAAARTEASGSLKARAASAQWRLVADQLRPKAPKLATLMDDAEHDVLA